MRKIKIYFLTLVACLIIPFSYGNGIEKEPKPFCIDWACCYVSWYGFQVGTTIISGTICFQSAGRISSGKLNDGNKENDLIAVQVIPAGTEPQEGELRVKEDARLVNKESGTTYLLKKGVYKTDENGLTELPLTLVD